MREDGRSREVSKDRYRRGREEANELPHRDRKKGCELCPRMWMVDADDDDDEKVISLIMNDEWVCAVSRRSRHRT